MKRLTVLASRGVLVGLLAACGCSTIIGADFDVEYEGDVNLDGSGGLDAVGGSTSNSGGVSSGGAVVGGTGSVATGGVVTGGAATGGAATGGAATGGNGTGGSLEEGALVINEVFAYGPDFIEIYNRDTVPHSMDYYRVAHKDPDSNGPDLPGSKPLGEVTVPAEGFVVFDVPGDFGFTISDEDTLYLLDASNNVVAVFDYFGPTLGLSSSRVPDGTDNYSQTNPTPGEPN